MTMNRIFIFPAFLFLCFSTSVQGQKLSRYQKNLMYEAEIYFLQGDYYYASELYNELHTSVPDDAEITGKLGICFFHLPTLKNQAEKYLVKAVQDGNTEALYYLAKQRISDYMFFDALDLMDVYQERSNRFRSETEIIHVIATAQLAIQMVQKPLSVTIKNMGENVNSPLHDYAPVWDAQGNKLYFTSRRRYDAGSEKDFSEQYDENIYIVDLNADKMTARGAGNLLNTRTNEAAVACSPDGKSLIFYRTSRDGFSGDLFLSEKEGYSWSSPERLNQEINSKYQEASACFGNKEGTLIYFSSDRPGGYGGKDIYKVVKLPDGSWSKAQNLGDKINTPFDDDGPYISIDGSLYFASQGHANMGGFDIFCAAKNGDDFDKPINLGYPINTPGDDVFFTIDPTGKMAYFSSERIGGFGLQDIYQIVFDDANNIIYKGEITTVGDQIPKNATVTLFNKVSGNMEGLYQTDPLAGTFVLALNTNKEYTMLVEAEGYQAVEKAVFFDEDQNGTIEVEEKIFLSK